MNTALFDIIWRDGVLYFFAIFSMNLVNIGFLTSAPQGLRAVNLTYASSPHLFNNQLTLSQAQHWYSKWYSPADSFSTFEARVGASPPPDQGWDQKAYSITTSQVVRPATTVPLKSVTGASRANGKSCRQIIQTSWTYQRPVHYHPHPTPIDMPSRSQRTCRILPCHTHSPTKRRWTLE